jgi:hypothetical protein
VHAAVSTSVADSRAASVWRSGGEAVGPPVEDEVRPIRVDQILTEPLDRGSRDECARSPVPRRACERDVLHAREAFVVARRLELAERPHLLGRRQHAGLLAARGLQLLG